MSKKNNHAVLVLTNAEKQQIAGGRCRCYMDDGKATEEIISNLFPTCDYKCCHDRGAVWWELSTLNKNETYTRTNSGVCKGKVMILAKALGYEGADVEPGTFEYVTATK